MPTFSVIMPVCNVERYLRNSVESVLKQSFKDFELILVDDGSPDNCATICDEYAAHDNRIFVIHKNNGGLSSARNTGIEFARGIYVLFLDSDDDLDNNALIKCWEIITETTCDLLIFGYRIITINENGVQHSGLVLPQKAMYVGENDIREHFIGLSNDRLYNYAWGKCYRLEVIKDNNVRSNCFFDKTNEDTVFLLQLFPFLKSIALLDSSLQNYYIREGQSITKRFVSKRYAQFYNKFLILKGLLDTFNGDKKEIDRYLCSEYCKSILWAYEFMFNAECKYDIWQRKKYIKKTFSISKENLQFRLRSVLYFHNAYEFHDISGFSRIAVNCILFRLFLMAWLCHCITLLKNKKGA